MLFGPDEPGNLNPSRSRSRSRSATPVRYANCCRLYAQGFEVSLPDGDRTCPDCERVLAHDAPRQLQFTTPSPLASQSPLATVEFTEYRNIGVCLLDLVPGQMCSTGLGTTNSQQFLYNSV